ncbi:hypothetical protein HA463_37850 (plasmid) [Rhizobium leguminosarum bv. trifolii]|nr:phosphopantetheine-binding protein [Rhizobium leguminosarum]QIO63385.1 hypothetical protein HA463_37850 [Rhizobium leguminosarum bv. trifolii]
MQTPKKRKSKPSSGETAVSLRAHLGGLLPDYMVPSAFVRLEALPLTMNGKLDRKALPVPDDDAYARRAYEAPLAGIWAELLGVERVGRHDNFFELGGHSLLAVRLLVRLTEALAVELPLAILFAKPTLAELARESSISLITQEFDSHQLQKLLSSRSLK